MPIHSLTPYARVADIHRSIAFYRRLGLEVQNSHFDDEVLAWAFLSTPTHDRRVAGARLMSSDFLDWSRRESARTAICSPW